VTSAPDDTRDAATPPDAQRLIEDAEARVEHAGGAFGVDHKAGVPKVQAPGRPREAPELTDVRTRLAVTTRHDVAQKPKRGPAPLAVTPQPACADESPGAVQGRREETPRRRGNDVDRDAAGGEDAPDLCVDDVGLLEVLEHVRREDDVDGGVGGWQPSTVVELDGVHGRGMTRDVDGPDLPTAPGENPGLRSVAAPEFEQARVCWHQRQRALEFDGTQPLKVTCGGRHRWGRLPSTTMTREFDVIMPAHDAEKTIARALRSVDAQTWRAARVIVVADACLDGTVDVARSFGVDVIAEELGSPGAARNRGLASASADWVAFLDSDDAWHPGWLEAVAHADERADVVAGRVMLVDEDAPGAKGARRRRLGPCPDDDDFRAALLAGPFITTSAVAARRQTVLAAGGFADWPVAEDFDLWLRLADAGAGWQFVEAALVDYHLTAGSAMRTPSRRRSIAEHHRRAVESSLGRRPLAPRAVDAARAVVALAAAERAIAGGATLEALRHSWDALRLRPGLRPAALAMAGAMPAPLTRRLLAARRRWQARGVAESSPTAP
jgi:GT2 family glycosyltransferase